MNSNGGFPHSGDATPTLYKDVMKEFKTRYAQANYLSYDTTGFDTRDTKVKNRPIFINAVIQTAFHHFIMGYVAAGRTITNESD